MRSGKSEDGQGQCQNPIACVSAEAHLRLILILRLQHVQRCEIVMKEGLVLRQQRPLSIQRAVGNPEPYVHKFAEFIFHVVTFARSPSQSFDGVECTVVWAKSPRPEF